ncbi:MAG: toll/interleukin-1 receptor domain-containing protein [Hyphomonadaceae bacterium]
MADVFISYAREDKARAEQVARALGAAGLDVFWDSEIPPGQTWADYIEDKLSNCKAVIVLWSANSTRSQWVREEARMGRDKGKLIPASLDDSMAPFGFGEVQAANLTTWQGQAGHVEWERMLAAVRAAVASPGQPAPSAKPAPQFQPAMTPPAASAAAKPWWRKTWVRVTGGVVALLVVLGVIGAVIPNPAPKPAEEEPAVETTAPTPPPAPAANDGLTIQQVLDNQLTQATQILGRSGYQPVGGPFNGALGAASSQSFPVTLQVGGDYKIVAACDRDCTDIDLTISDQNNNTVASDVELDDHPIVSVTPRWTGPFMINVQMVTCSQEPCYFLGQVYAKPAAQ